MFFIGKKKVGLFEQCTGIAIHGPTHKKQFYTYITGVLNMPYNFSSFVILRSFYGYHILLV